MRDLRSRVATVLVPGGADGRTTPIFTNADNSFRMGNVHRDDWPLIMMVAVASIAGVAAAFPRDHFSMALALSGVGFAISVVFALLRAPDVALVAVLVETLFGLFAFWLCSRATWSMPMSSPRMSHRKRRILTRVRAIALAAFGGCWHSWRRGACSPVWPGRQHPEEYVDLTWKLMATPS
ncbi:MAG: hydrogenase subunit MbhD domain-containing protein [Thermomicrobiales bacterium]